MADLAQHWIASIAQAIESGACMVTEYGLTRNDPRTVYFDTFPTWQRATEPLTFHIREDDLCLRCDHSPHGPLPTTEAQRREIERLIRVASEQHDAAGRAISYRRG